MKRIYLIATIFTVLIICIAVVASVMLMKPITDEPEGGDYLPPPGPNDTTGPDDTTETFDVPWLKEGNRWFISWSSFSKGAHDSTRWSDYDHGFYTMKLGAPQEKEGMQMYELILDGDTESHTPKWKWIGTDNYGNIYGLKADADAPVFIFSYVVDDTSHNGFYSTFDENKYISINRNGHMPSSQYTAESGFSGILSSIGYSQNNVHYDEAGATYFPGYGTIYTEGGTGAGPDVDNKMHAEYWSLEAGPVGMHYLSNYENWLGWWGSAKHYETYIVATSFGDESLILPHFETEPDTYADPTLLTIDAIREQKIDQVYVYTLAGQVDAYDNPSTNVENDYDLVLNIQDPIARIEGLEKAKRVHDWYKFEITEPFASKTFEFYLCWNDVDQNMKFHLFTAPDNPTYGFVYIGSHHFTDSIEEFSRSIGFGGTYLPGTYLLGVERDERTGSSNSALGYGLMVFLEE